MSPGYLDELARSQIGDEPVEVGVGEPAVEPGADPVPEGVHLAGPRGAGRGESLADVLHRRDGAGAGGGGLLLRGLGPSGDRGKRGMAVDRAAVLGAHVPDEGVESLVGGDDVELVAGMSRREIAEVEGDVEVERVAPGGGALDVAGVGSEGLQGHDQVRGDLVLVRSQEDEDAGVRLAVGMEVARADVLVVDEDPVGHGGRRWALWSANCSASAVPCSFRRRACRGEPHGGHPGLKAGESVVARAVPGAVV